MTQNTYTVFLPDRPLPICVEADAFAVFGCELVLSKDGNAVARTSDRGFVVQTDLARESCANAERLSWELKRPTVEPIATGTVAEIKSHPSPVWPFLAGVGVAFVLMCGAASWLV
ncbi:hypothetical protein RBU55_07465 [Pseudomonas chlororaphis subsp. aurantiaca]|uniref:hypothetical protein n=1 Tax=Pseudomonas chlororaphis TaxID=587753 RepID=UPI0027DB506A|nr:hypothetical protein [Pseudomonas chlororaphis]WMJ01382.1 hypothetical protein RBU55_07465 [Pseudomonas chlororaphis subsp. aurantiaca]